MFEHARAASRQARSLRRVGHRPFPLPNSRWTLGQTWEQTFWAHWLVPAEEIRARVPEELEIEEHDGSAWLSIVFFRVRALRARGAFPVPGISSFMQLNVRTYVRGPDSLPGVWFFSIDASSRLAALGVRRIYRVPAFHARMTLDSVGEWQAVECVRIRSANARAASTNCGSFKVTSACSGVDVVGRATVHTSRFGASNVVMFGGGAVRFQ